MKHLFFLSICLLNSYWLDPHFAGADSDIVLPAKLRAVSVKAVDDLYTFVLPVDAYRKENEVWLVTARGKFEGKDAGLLVEIRKNSPEEIASGNKGEFSVRFELQGEAGKNLFQLLGKSVGVSVDRTPKASHLFEANGKSDARVRSDSLPEEFELINLHDEENYCEWYLFLGQDSIEIREKSLMYRQPFFTTLSSR